MSRQIFSCLGCGHEAPRWFGRCPSCDAWGSCSDSAPSGVTLERTLLAAVAGDDPRLSSGMDDVDRVFGGGIVPGSVVLLAGEPGIGKSTLVLQLVDGLTTGRYRALLMTGEESLPQVAARASRLGLSADRIEAAASGSVRDVLGVLQDRVDVVVVDSIQTMVDEEASGAAGSVGQVRGCAATICRAAKATGVAVVLIGHVTKDGQVAGPKTLEHMVDAVLTLEGDRSGSLRVLRAAKNRYGSCEETAILSMAPHGLEPVPDPSTVLLADRVPEAAGSVVFPAREGSRVMLIEVQALVTPSQVSRRVAIGIDHRRLSMQLGVLTQHADVTVDGHDVFVAVAGGLALRDPSVDLAACLAVSSAQRGEPLDATTVAFGEVGLSGEVRRVPGAERRLIEAARHGFTRAIAPRGSPLVHGLEVCEVASLREAVALCRELRRAAA